MLSGPYKFSVRRKWLADSMLADILERLIGIILGTSGVLLSCLWCCRKFLSGRQVSRCVPFGCTQVCMLGIMAGMDHKDSSSEFVIALSLLLVCSFPVTSHHLRQRLPLRGSAVRKLPHSILVTVDAKRFRCAEILSQPVGL